MAIFDYHYSSFILEASLVWQGNTDKLLPRSTLDSDLTESLIGQEELAAGRLVSKRGDFGILEFRNFQFNKGISLEMSFCEFFWGLRGWNTSYHMTTTNHNIQIII